MNKVSNNKITRLKLSSPREIRESLAKVGRMLLRGEVDAKTANTFTYIANAILTSIRADEQEKKINELQEFVEQLKVQNG